MSEPDATPPESDQDAVPATPAPEAPSPEAPSKEELRLAMKAFRKKLKLMRLDEESSLGYGPTSKGQQSQVGAITPPHQFPKEIWKELARQGKLRQETSTLFSLVELN